MPRMTDLIKSIQVGDRKFNNPEWWKTQQKLKKATKYNEVVKKVVKRMNTRTQYQVVTLERQPSMDQYMASLRTDIDMDKYKVFAPWDPVFRKSKTVITFFDSAPPSL